MSSLLSAITTTHNPTFKEPNAPAGMIVEAAQPGVSNCHVAGVSTHESVYEEMAIPGSGLPARMAANTMYDSGSPIENQEQPSAGATYDDVLDNLGNLADHGEGNDAPFDCFANDGANTDC